MRARPRSTSVAADCPKSAMLSVSCRSGILSSCTIGRCWPMSQSSPPKGSSVIATRSWDTGRGPTTPLHRQGVLRGLTAAAPHPGHNAPRPRLYEWGRQLCRLRILTMVTIPETNPFDPTLAAVDRAIEERAAQQPSRPYLGMSAIGHPCARALWYSFRWVASKQWSAEVLKRFDDGDRGEEVMAARLRLVSGITLLTIDPQTG